MEMPTDHGPRRQMRMEADEEEQEEELLENMDNKKKGKKKDEEGKEEAEEDQERRKEVLETLGAIIKKKRNMREDDELDLPRLLKESLLDYLLSCLKKIRRRCKRKSYWRMATSKRKALKARIKKRGEMKKRRKKKANKNNNNLEEEDEEEVEAEHKEDEKEMLERFEAEGSADPDNNNININNDVDKEEDDEDEEDWEDLEIDEIDDFGDLTDIALCAVKTKVPAETMVWMMSRGGKRMSVEKLQRAMDDCQWKPRILAPPPEEDEEEETEVTCIMFGIREDLLRIRPKEEDPNGREDPSGYMQGFARQRSLTLTSEPGGAYIGHLTPFNDDPRTIADRIHFFLVQHGIDESLVYFGGVGGGNGVGGVEGAGQVAHFLEERLGHRLVRVVCELDTNEISLRRVVEELAGPYKEENPGKLWELVRDVHPNSETHRHFGFDPNFETLPSLSPLREIPAEILAGLPADQEYVYRITKMITTGVIDHELLKLDLEDYLFGHLFGLDEPNTNWTNLDNPDENDHSRWLMVAGLFALLWISKHGLTGKDKATLRAIVQLIVSVYVVLRFEIQADSSLVGGPQRKLKEIQILHRIKAKNSALKKAKEAALRAAERGAWHAHSEHVLLSLLSSEDEDDRQFAIAKIMKIRGDGRRKSISGDSSPRPYFPPQLNREATSIRSLQDWTNATEPIVTTRMSDEQVQQILKTPLPVPKIPAHSRCCLRCAKRVCKASKDVFGRDQQEAHIRASGKSRQLIPRFQIEYRFVQTPPSGNKIP